MSSTTEESEPQSDWLNPKREALLIALNLSEMSLDSIMTVLHALKTEEQLTKMGRGWIKHLDKTGKFLTHDEVMTAVLSIRRTGKFSLTE